MTLADIRRVAAERLRRDNRTVGVYLPTAQPERAPAPARVDVATLVKDYKGDPGAAQAESFDPTPANLDARTQRFVLDSGLKVALLPKGTRGQAVHARLRLRFGDVATLNGQDAVAGFVGALLDKGGAGLTRQQIADQFDRLQADVGFSAQGQAVGVDITTKRDRLPAVIELVGKLLREPNFSAPALEEYRVQWLTAIERQKKEPDALIRNKLARYGNPYPRGDIRYEGTFEEDEQDVRAVTLAQVAAFHRRFYSAAYGEFSAAGDLEPAAVRQAVTAAFGGWKQPAGGARAVHPRAAAADRTRTDALHGGHARPGEREPARPAAGAAHGHRCRLSGPAHGQLPVRLGRLVAPVEADPRERRPELRRALRRRLESRRAELELDRQRDLRAAEPAEGRGGAARGAGALDQGRLHPEGARRSPGRPAQPAPAVARPGRQRRQPARLRPAPRPHVRLRPARRPGDRDS